MDASALVVPIGYDDEEPWSFTLLLGFSAMAGGDLEYFFCVVQADHETGQKTQMFSGLETRLIFNKSDREHVLGAALWGTEKLLELVAPARFFCCTFDADLPERALTKHKRLVDRFRMCGYQVSPQPFRLGKHSWYLDKIAQGE
jgi:hypothetical protein